MIELAKVHIPFVLLHDLSTFSCLRKSCCLQDLWNPHYKFVMVLIPMMMIMTHVLTLRLTELLLSLLSDQRSEYDKSKLPEYDITGYTFFRNLAII